MCPTAERRSAGFTLLELLIVLVIMGVLVAVGAGALSVERNPLYTGAQALVTASSTARSRALLLNAPVTLELGQTFMEISSENGDRPLREAFPKGMSAASVDEHYLLGGSQKLLFHPLGVVQEHVVHLQSGQDTLSVYIPATGTARILEGQFSLEQIRKEFIVLAGKVGTDPCFRMGVQPEAAMRTKAVQRAAAAKRKGDRREGPNCGTVR